MRKGHLTTQYIFQRKGVFHQKSSVKEFDCTCDTFVTEI